MNASRLYAASLTILLMSLTVPARAVVQAGPPDITVTVTDADDTTAIAGAFVALMGDGGRNGGVTNDSGQITFADVTEGDYAMTVSAPGYVVSAQPSVTITALDPSLDVSLTDSGAMFDGLGADGAQTSAILSDGLSGVFYLTATSIPSLYRTADYGGHWAPVTISTDDPLAGIDGSGTAAGATTSGFPGEIAAVVDNKVWFSRDFGNTWKSITAPPTGNGGGLLWGHVGAQSTLFAVNGTNTEMYFADMPTGSETTVPSVFTAMSSSYKQAGGDEVAIANGSVAPVVAVAPASGGDVVLYEVAASPSRAVDPSTTVTGSGPGAAPTFTRVGGPATAPLGSGLAPNTVLTFSNAARSGDGHAVMASYDDVGSGSAWYATDGTPVFHNQDNDLVNTGLSRWSQDPAACGGMEGSIGSVAPQGQTGTVSMCWVTQEGAALDEMHVRQVRFINNNTGIAFDAGYNGSTNRVLISGDGEKGATKSASEAVGMNRPSFLEWPAQATAGTDPGSGGVSVEGIGAAVVRDTDFGPAGSSQMVTALSFTGGGRVLASANGGDDWTWIAGDGASAAEWWATDGVNESWILAGAGGQSSLLVGADIPADASTSGDAPDAHVPTNALSAGGGPGGGALSGTDAASFGVNGASGTAATSIIGVDGTDVAFVGTATNAGDDGSVRKVTVSGTRAGNNRAASVTAPGEFDTIAAPVSAMTYCPAAGSDVTTADTLYVALATSGATPGGIAAIRGALSGAATVEMATDVDTGVTLEGDFNDVRADCAGGQIFAGKSSASGPPMLVNQPPPAALLVSLDGGASFDEITIDPPAGSQPSADVMDVETFDVQPGDPNVPGDPDMIVVVGGSGDVAVGLVDATGGADLLPVNDPDDADGRSFGGERAGDVNIPPEVPQAPAAPNARASANVRAAASASVTDAGAVLGSGAGLFRMEATDLTAPTAPGLAALTAIQASNRVRLTWTASTDGESGIAAYRVIFRRLRFTDTSYTASANPWQTLAGSATTVLLPAVTPGYQYCFKVVAVNGSGLGTNSTERCTVVPLDDPSLTKSSTSWRTYGPSSSYAGTYLSGYTQSATKLQTLRWGTTTRPGVRNARKLVVVATKCTTCGIIEVYIGTTKVSTLNLAYSSTRKMQYLTAYSSSTARTGPVTLKIVSATGKLVRIEGLAAVR